MYLALAKTEFSMVQQVLFNHGGLQEIQLANPFSHIGNEMVS